jgi:guanylate kinase
MLQQEFPKQFGFSVSNTTRGPREGEIDGIHYNFMTKELFLDGIEKNKFIEHAFVHTNMYGTTFEGVDRVRILGCCRPTCVYVFL